MFPRQSFGFTNPFVTGINSTACAFGLTPGASAFNVSPFPGLPITGHSFAGPFGTPSIGSPFGANPFAWTPYQGYPFGTNPFHGVSPFPPSPYAGNPLAAVAYGVQPTVLPINPFLSHSLPIGSNPGINPGFLNPTAGQFTNPVGIGPLGISPLGLNPAGINPLGPIGFNPVGINTGFNPVGINPVGINPLVAALNPIAIAQLAATNPLIGSALLAQSLGNPALGADPSLLQAQQVSQAAQFPIRPLVSQPAQYPGLPTPFAGQPIDPYAGLIQAQLIASLTNPLSQLTRGFAGVPWAAGSLDPTLIGQVGPFAQPNSVPCSVV
ncbi:MAG TPA: hypothetical protein VJX67_22440 [Blastocatellia bacterium]|nr:hypothetical protein [Blastocatellia bacterium]